MRIRRVNESLDHNEILKDALTELSDTYFVKIFTIYRKRAVSSTRILVKLNNYNPGLDSSTGTYHFYLKQHMELAKESLSEQSKIFDLIEEALVRAHINYSEIRFKILFAEDVIGFMDHSYEVDNIGEDDNLHSDYFMGFDIQ